MKRRWISKTGTGEWYATDKLNGMRPAGTSSLRYHGNYSDYHQHGRAEQANAATSRFLRSPRFLLLRGSSHLLPVRLIFHPKFEKPGENQMEGETERAFHFLGCGRYPHNRSFSLIWTIISSQVSFIKHLFEFIKEIGWRGSTWFRWNLMFQGHEDWSVRNIPDIGTFLDKSNGKGLKSRDIFWGHFIYLIDYSLTQNKWLAGNISLLHPALSLFVIL